MTDNQVIKIEFECCDSSYTQPISLKPDQLLLHTPHALELPEFLIEAQHAVEHPDCDGEAS